MANTLFVVALLVLCVIFAGSILLILRRSWIPDRVLYARRTRRLTDALQLLGFAVGGEAGAQLAQRLGMQTSPDTLLRYLRQAGHVVRLTPRVLGVDDLYWKPIWNILEAAGFTLMLAPILFR